MNRRNEECPCGLLTLVLKETYDALQCFFPVGCIIYTPQFFVDVKVLQKLKILAVKGTAPPQKHRELETLGCVSTIHSLVVMVAGL